MYVNPDFIGPIELLTLFVPIFLYAEVHFRLPFFAGRIFKRQPEILFDLPYRIEAADLPILFLVKDADRFPIHLYEVAILLKDSKSGDLREHFSFVEEQVIQKKWFHKVYPIPVSRYASQTLRVECRATVRIGSQVITVRNDNYRGLSHSDFQTFIDTETLPGPPGWIAGDLHCHSAWTEDQVEFGVPAEAIYPLAKALGLSFCALLDHSYDLDDKPGSWTEPDPDLQRWSASRKMIAGLNREQSDFLIIPGEEVSADNGLGRNVHLGVLNHPDFFPGSGDSMEIYLRSRSESHYAHILEQLADDAMAFAAHPLAPTPFLQRLLISRGAWNRHDYHRKLSGFQIINGVPGGEIRNGKSAWIRQLLHGRKVFIYAGNDSHGNFNRFRQVKLPLWKLHEHQVQLFGQFINYVRTDINSGLPALIRALRSGHSIVSNGPFVALELENGNGEICCTGQTLVAPPLRIHVFARSSLFFGSLKEIRIFQGDLLKQEEQQLPVVYLKNHISEYRGQIATAQLPDRGYLRAEVSTHTGKFALTNPIWFEQNAAKNKGENRLS